MKIISCLLLGSGLNWQQPLELFGKSTTKLDTKNEQQKIFNLLDVAKSNGPVGSILAEEKRRELQAVAKSIFPLSISKPARYNLTGVHNLVYSAAPGASSGKIGPLIGKVSQYFEDDEIFYNRVNFGPLQIALRAKRETMNDSTIKVSFLETSFNLFGQTIKKQQAGGGGVWKVKFVGKVEDENGKEKLVRIMETPSLFVLEHDL
jgi:hypothetical protein